MPTIRAAKSVLPHARRRGARGLFRLASCILRHGIKLYERRMIPPIVLRVSLFAVRVLERSAAALAFGHRLHDGPVHPDRSDQR